MAQQHLLELPAACCWTGRVAAWAPFPPQPPAGAGQPGGGPGGLPQLKTSSRGVWLRSEQGGVLAVQWRAAAGLPVLSFTLRSSQQLVRAPLAPGGFAFRLLCPAHGAPPPAAGGSSGHILFLSLGGSSDSSSGGSKAGSTDPPGGPSQRTFAVHFDTAQAGRECGALLQAIHQGSLEMATPPAAPALPVLHRSGTAAAATAAPAGGLNSAQQCSEAVGCVGSEAAAAAALAAVDAAGAAFLDGGGLFGYADEASLEAAIQAAQEDPSFQAYVALWEQGVARVESFLR